MREYFARTAFMSTFGLRIPFVGAAMSGHSDAALAGAVARAGGLGFLGAGESPRACLFERSEALQANSLQRQDRTRSRLLDCIISGRKRTQHRPRLRRPLSAICKVDFILQAEARGFRTLRRLHRSVVGADVIEWHASDCADV